MEYAQPLELVFGVGPVLAAKLASQGIRTREQLIKAATSGKVKLSKLTLLDLRYPIVRKLPRKIITPLESQLPDNAVLVGSYRRKKPFLGDVDVLIFEKDGATEHTPLPQMFADMMIYRQSDRDVSGVWKLPPVAKVRKAIVSDIKREEAKDEPVASPPYAIPKGSTKLTGRSTALYAIVDIFYAYESERPFAMMHFTGPMEFNVRVRFVAKKKGYKLNQYGLFDQSGKNIGADFKTEREIFDKLDITWKEPEDR